MAIIGRLLITGAALPYGLKRAITPSALQPIGLWARTMFWSVPETTP